MEQRLESERERIREEERAKLGVNQEEKPAKEEFLAEPEPEPEVEIEKGGIGFAYIFVIVSLLCGIVYLFLKTEFKASYIISIACIVLAAVGVVLAIIATSKKTRPFAKLLNKTLVFIALAIIAFLVLSMVLEIPGGLR